jgi:ribosomal protein S18 acetylase RimI-like enzyme
VTRPASSEETGFVEGLIAADVQARLGSLPTELRHQLVSLQVRAQRSHLASAWPEARDRILVDETGAGVGRLLVGRSGAVLHVLDLRVATAHRGRGIASAALGALLDEADAEGLAVELHVEPGNPARRLYERLGFVVEPGPGGAGAPDAPAASGAPAVDLVMRRPPR